MDHDVVLAGDGLRLRPFRRGAGEDLALLLELAEDPAVRQWSRSLRQVRVRADATAWIEARLAAPESYDWVVIATADGGLLGRMGLHRDDGNVELAYATVPRARGHGVARRAAGLAAQYAHDGLGEARVGIVHAVANPASCRVALACGMAQEATVRGGLDHGDGIGWDLHVHSRLTQDPWEAIAPLPLPPHPVEVVGEGIVLRAWTQHGAATMARVATDPMIASWAPFRLCGRDDVRRWIDAAGAWADAATWAVHDAAGAQLLGSVRLQDLDEANSSAEVGYWIVPEARGRGVAARAVRAAVRFGSEQLGLRRFTLIHAVDNTASCRVAGRAGFVMEATLRRAYRYGDGRLHDDHLHARVFGG